MRNNRTNYALVGGVSLVGLIGFLALVAVLLRVGPGDVYHVYYSDVAGLSKGIPVHYQGFRVGDVDRITAAQDGRTTRYKVEFDVPSGWKVPSDSVARITPAGMLGAVIIDITEGHATESLSPGSEMKGAESPDIFTVLQSVAGVLGEIDAAGVRPLIDNLNRSSKVLAEQLEGSGNDIVGNVRAASGDLERVARDLHQLLRPENRAQIERAVGDFSTTAHNLQQFSDRLAQTQTQVDRLLTDSRAVLDDNQQDLRSTVQSMRETMVGLSEQMNVITHNIETSSRNMNELSYRLRRNPGALLGIRAAGTDGEEQP